MLKHKCWRKVHQMAGTGVFVLKEEASKGWDSDTRGKSAVGPVLAFLGGDMMRQVLQVLEKGQIGCSCCYRKGLPLLGLKGEVGVTLTGAGSR